MPTLETLIAFFATTAVFAYILDPAMLHAALMVGQGFRLALDRG